MTTGRVVLLTPGLLALLLLAPVPGGLAAPAGVWWEAESPAATSFPDRTWLSASTFPEKRGVLSGGEWLTSDGPRGAAEAFARWDVEIPETATYGLWARKFWKHGPFRWRFDDGDWRTCGRDVALADSVPIRTHVVVNWVNLGEVALERGRRRFEIRLLAGPGESTTAAFDCFHLARGPFAPRGRLRPGEPSDRTEPGWWAFEPDPDPFADAVLDLRDLNEERAGQSGPVRRDGDGFRLGDGTPVRFWGVNCGPELVRQDAASVRYLARRLARRGVNAVRIHGPIFDRAAADRARVDRAYLDRLGFFVAAMADEGIYATLSFWFPLWLDVRPGDGLDGYESTGNKKPFGLLFFDPRMQEMHRSWLTALLAGENPHRGRPLGREPAVAMVEIVNEDSLLFWTFRPGETIPLARIESLEQRFAGWLSRRYGSAEKARRARDGAEHPRDDPAGGRVALLPAWNLTGKGHGEGAARRRASDQLRFLVETQKAWYESTVKFIREDLGSKALVVCGNWKTADPRVLGVLERWTCCAGDVIDRHGYFGGRHEGEGASWSVRVGHRFADRAAVKSPEGLPLDVGQMAGFPQIVSEIGWPSPNRYRADYPVLAAAFGARQGLDGLFFFACGGPGFDGGVRKFPVDVPTVLGQSPACALIYRRGDVVEAEPVVRETLALEDLYDFRGSAHRTPPALDALRAGDGPRDPSAAAGLVDPLAWILGPVTATIASRGELRVSRGVEKRIDREAKIVRGDDLVWDWGRGVVTIDTPRAQAVTGFLAAAGRTTLGDVVIESGNEYGSVLAVSLDGEPLSRSCRVLLQAVTEEKPWGWRVDGDRIVDLGEPPMLVRDVDVRVTIRGGRRLSVARALDPNGRERRRLPVAATGRDVRIKLPADGLYVVLERP